MPGFRRFREKYFLSADADHSLYGRLATVGQSPKTLLIGCSDSRADPAILTDAQRGQIMRQEHSIIAKPFTPADLMVALARIAPPRSGLDAA